MKSTLNSTYMHIALGLATVVAGYLATVDWTTLFPTKAGMIVMVIGAIKAALSASA